MVDSPKITLRAARVNAELTQKELAEKLGKSENTIINWETGKTKISVVDFLEVCRVLNVNSSQIFLQYKSS